MVVVVITCEMRHGPLVAVAESFTIRIAILVRDVGMAVLIVIIGIRMTMMFEVMAGRFDAFVIASLLNIAVIGRGPIPIIPILGRASGGGRSIRRGCMRLHHRRAQECQ